VTTEAASPRVAAALARSEGAAPPSPEPSVLGLPPRSDTGEVCTLSFAQQLLRAAEAGARATSAALAIAAAGEASAGAPAAPAAPLAPVVLLECGPSTMRPLY
jgi:hypothetical protein